MLKLKNFSYATQRSDDITHFMKTAGESGGIVCYVNTEDFTNDPDDPNNVVGYVATPDANSKPVGLLMQSVLDYDPTRVERNFQNPFEVPINSKVWVTTSGYFDTNMVVAADLAGVDAGDTAYLGAAGKLTTDSAAPSLVVGRFESSADTDGYVKLSLNIK